MNPAVAGVMACHFVAAFAALGMPPFFALVLQRSLHNDAVFLSGWLYVVPIFFTALSSPWWGRLADRYGKKPLLLRAQLGLAASFLLAGFAPNTWAFFGALVLQGLLGGTFSASNAYLATMVSGPALARSLTMMQWSARAALVVAPAGLGWWIAQLDSPLQAYRWLALLPAAAALLIWHLPDAARDAAPRAASQPCAPAEAGARQIYLLQFAFIFATVLTFPYFLPYLEAKGLGGLMLGGALFGLPHLVYLACAAPLGRWRAHGPQLPFLAIAFLLLAASLAGQAAVQGLGALVAWRIVMGLAMTAAYVSLHGLIASVVHSTSAGATFGWFESSAKWGAVMAGILSGLLAHSFAPGAPFLAGALASLAAGTALACWPLIRSRTTTPQLEKP